MRKSALALVVGSILLTSHARAEDTLGTWVVVGAANTKGPVFLSRSAETALGSFGEWRCVASKVEASTMEDGRRKETVSLTCANGDLAVRTHGEAIEGERPNAGVPLQVLRAGKPIVTLVLGMTTRK